MTSPPAVAYPASEWTLMLFASWLAQIEHLSPASISVYLSAVRSSHIELGFSDPMAHCLRLPRVIRGIKRTMPGRQSPRLPITKRLLDIIYSSLDMQLVDHAMFWASCCVAFFGFLRVSEFTTEGSFDASKHLGIDDVAADTLGNPSMIRLTIKASKCDQFRAGSVVYIGRAHPPTCAVSALLSYLHLRGPTPGPLFRWTTGSPLTAREVNTHLHSILSRAGIHGNYSSHSFRIGAATAAAAAGIPDHLIKVMGRWSSTAYQRYIRSSPSTLANVAQHLA